VITNFADAATEDIFNGNDTKAAARAVPKVLWTVARRKLDMLNAARNLLDLTVPPNNRLKAMKGDLKGKYEIRINDQFRIVFAWRDGTASDVQAGDFH
jgi:proteic killer suppression protein